MWKTACVVLAASLIFPFLVSRAAPPDEDPAAPDTETAVEPSLKLFGEDLPEDFELPEELRSLTPEQRRDVLEAYAGWIEIQTPESRSDRPGGVCLAGGGKSDLCAAAARISYSRPCLAAGGVDCPALEDWKEVMGTPGLRPAPKALARANLRLPSPEPPRDE